MDYYGIGQRIRNYRKAQGWSQEQLAEAVGISVTHMSHIETANTKLSLPVFAAIAQALDVQTDELLGNTPARRTLTDELSVILDGCSAEQLRILTDILKAAKTSMDKHRF